MGKNQVVATAVQTNCERCGGELVPGASYCDRCGERTRRARGSVRLVVRIELIALALMLVLTVVFAWVFIAQGSTR
jgi:predicted nucleic acid-binding Zn ribbon protein